MNVGESIRLRMKQMGYSQVKLAKLAQISQSGISTILSGASNPSAATLQAIATALNCSVAELMGEDVISSIPIIRNAVPIVGEIACGVPIMAEQNIDGFADLPDGIRADFALRCKGDSMQPTFAPGDLVLIRQQEEVEHGQIAAVGINGEATLKRFYRSGDGFMLVADNPAFAPQVYPAGADVKIYGLAVGFVRMWN